MTEKSNFEERIDQVFSALTAMLESHRRNGIRGTESINWLGELYKHYSDRTLSNNERIWRTGALFVPVSLAAFAALTAIKEPQVWHVVVLMTPSIGLMWAWIVIAENHRSFQQNSQAWLIAI